MAHPTKQESLEIAVRRTKIIKMHVARVPTYRIAEELQIPRYTVRHDINEVKRKYLKAGLRDVALLVAEEAMLLDDMIRKAMNQFGLKPDPKWLDIVLKAETRIAELYGLNKPKLIAPTTPDGQHSYNPLGDLPTNELIQRAAELAQRMAEELTAQATTPQEPIDVTPSEQDRIASG